MRKRIWGLVLATAILVGALAAVKDVNATSLNACSASYVAWTGLNSSDSNGVCHSSLESALNLVNTTPGRYIWLIKSGTYEVTQDYPNLALSVRVKAPGAVINGQGHKFKSIAATSLGASSTTTSVTFENFTVESEEAKSGLVVLMGGPVTFRNVIVRYLGETSADTVGVQLALADAILENVTVENYLIGIYANVANFELDGVDLSSAKYSLVKEGGGRVRAVNSNLGQIVATNYTSEGGLDSMPLEGMDFDDSNKFNTNTFWLVDKTLDAEALTAAGLMWPVEYGSSDETSPLPVLNDGVTILYSAVDDGYDGVSVSRSHQVIMAVGEKKGLIDAADDIKIYNTESGELISILLDTEWESSDPSVAEVRDGKIISKKPGEATLTANFIHGDTVVKETIKVTVKGEESEESEEVNPNTVDSCVRTLVVCSAFMMCGGAILYRWLARR